MNPEERVPTAANLSLTRRRFFAVLGVGAASAALAHAGFAQQSVVDGFNGPMDMDRYRPVRLPARGTPPVLSAEQRDALEHRIHCQCGCTLDIYTCRTTDFSCTVSPRMHRDVVTLAGQGYDAQAILDAFTGVYGERVLMEPRKEGFNWAGYIMPFAALAAGAAAVAATLRRWGKTAAAVQAATPVQVDASPDELAKLDALVRRDDA
ncbi:MAG TPA: cytochrome c-type biogenesis protein CcmH [Gemmatimonadaceae bacterium]|nr:cytochrome c-type biogenesis protein CcmH [Gemmatimonadaceae bacterium]